MRNIHSDYITCDMPIAEFQELCKCTFKVVLFNIVLINKDEHPVSGQVF
jgi:hypothetical protein